MLSWELFEISCTDYLNKNFNYRNVRFIHGGGSSSINSDISVFQDNKKIFDIECKFSPAQSSQFVVLSDSKKSKFVFSHKNKSPESDAKDILLHMNNNFEYYSKTDSKGKINNKLFCQESLKVDYVKKNISQKSSLIISSSYKEGFSNKRPLFVGEISELHKFFDIEGIYRGKYSGTKHASNKTIKDFSFETAFIEGRYYIYDPGKKVNDYPNNRAFFLSKKLQYGGYREVRIPSNTLNSNVIFTLKLNRESHSDLSILRSMVDQKIVS